MTLNVMGDRFCIFLFALLFTSYGCVKKPSEMVNVMSSRDVIFYDKLSNYCGESSLALKDNVVILDSNHIKSIGLILYYFQDKRVSSRYWKKGIAVYDSVMDNWYVNYDRLPGDTRVTGVISEIAASYLPIHGIFKPGNVIHKFDFYYLRNYVMSQRGEAILNNLSLSHMERLARSELDSFFRVFFFYDDKGSISDIDLNLYVSKLDEFKSKFMSDNYKFENKKDSMALRKNITYNDSCFNDFKLFVNQNYNRNSFFLYYYQHKPWLVTVNEHFENLDGGGQIFFVKSFNYSRKNFSIKIYEPYWVIDNK